jgi:4-methyl-5(b-hydroxyethyl)-thiazole monophosphate biosynthesis
LSGQENFDLLILPGGQPGTTNLCTSTRVLELVRKSFEQKKLVGAICAAPLVLSKAGVLTNKNITCFPGTPISDQTVTIQNNPVVIDGQLVTSKGMGTSIAFALALVERTTNAEIAQKIGQSIQYYSSN